MLRLFFLSLLLALATPLAACAADAPKPPAGPTEADYYPLTTLPLPKDVVLEIGAIELLPKDRIAFSTRRGDIYLVDGAFAPQPSADKLKFTLFASGLHEVLGLVYRDGALYATQRGEMTKITDTDGDGRADEFRTFADGWGINGDYHEYAFGSAPDFSATSSAT